MTAPVARVTYRQVLAIREFRALLAAELLSVAGDQIARIAIALLVYSRSGSAFLAAATYACSYLIWLLAGPLLSAIADRRAARQLMVACDLVRAALIALLLLPGLPLVAIFATLLAVAALSPPFDSARGALLPRVLGDEVYTAGNALQNSIFTSGQVLGFAGGGALVAALGVPGALLLDVVSFVLSAAVLRYGILERREVAGGSERQSLWRETIAGAQLVGGQPMLRWLLGLACTGMAVTIPTEGLAVPAAAAVGGGSTSAGFLSAAMPAGYIVGAFLVSRRPRDQRLRLQVPLLALSAVPLLLSPLMPTSASLACLWVIAGVGSALQVIANAEYVLAIPPGLRGRAFGLAATALMGTQGLVLLLAGTLADVVDPRTVVAGGGVLALVAALALAHWAPASARGSRSQGKALSRRRH